jgi:hypothetical protein
LDAKPQYLRIAQRIQNIRITKRFSESIKGFRVNVLKPGNMADTRRQRVVRVARAIYLKNHVDGQTLAHLGNLKA